MNIDKKFYNFIKKNMSHVKIIGTDRFHSSFEFEKVKFLFIILFMMWNLLSLCEKIQKIRDSKLNFLKKKNRFNKIIFYIRLNLHNFLRNDFKINKLIKRIRIEQHA